MADGLGRGRTFGAPPDQDEFVARQPAQHVARLHALAQPLDHLDQHIVAHVVAHGFVDRLEPVEIEIGQHDLFVFVFARCQQRCDPLHHICPVWQPEQRIVQGIVLRASLARRQFARDAQRLPNQDQRERQHNAIEHHVTDQQRRGAGQQERANHVRLPGQPAEHAIIAVNQSQPVATGIGGLRAGEAQVVQQGSRTDLLEHCRVEPADRDHVVRSAMQQLIIGVW